MIGAVEPFVSFRDRLISDGWVSGAESELAARLDGVVIALAGDVGQGTAVVATGGFGRGVMAVHSDVDLMFLHAGGGEDDLARRVLRPLWDARLKVGHLSHTPKSARIFAGTRLDAVSTFLSARFLCGDAEVFADFRARFTKLLEKEHARIVDAMAAEERRRREEEPYRLMAADLKNGRGGLRTLDMVDWRRRLFEAHSAQAPALSADDHALRVALTRVRSAVHVAAGRTHDTFDFELRQQAAGWLGCSVRQLGAEILGLRSSVERMVDSTWSAVARPPHPADFPQSLRPPNRGESVAWFDLAPAAIRRLCDEPHVVAFHRHPVGDHTLAAVDLAWLVVDGAMDDPVAAEAVASVDRPERLAVAALLHDIGKGPDGDHSRLGATLVADLCRELAVSEGDVPLYRRLVEHHLLLADLATRFDIDDPAVIGWAADRIPDAESLRFLLLLTTVDSMAAGPDVWTPWRAELVRRAFRRLERELVRRSLPDDAQLSVLADSVVTAADGEFELLAARTHIAGFGPAYRRAHSPELIVEHMRLAFEPLGPGGGTVRMRLGLPARMIVTATDRPRLAVDIAAVLAANRMSITDARFATRLDGQVFDTFEMVDANGGAASETTLERVHADVVRVLRGALDPAKALEEKQRAYRDTGRKAVPVHVSVTRSDDGGGSVEVEAGDRIGLLRDLCLVFDGFGMPILRARIDTRAGVAYDTFQVARLPVEIEPLVDSLGTAAGG
ncbi:MAG TPA: HD domain-containing protein [Acidimicrobiia bacterium]|nr:HD domain-containing protein [Acidimicrobiia bacterium]